MKRPAIRLSARREVWRSLSLAGKVQVWWWMRRSERAVWKWLANETPFPVVWRWDAWRGEVYGRSLVEDWKEIARYKLPRDGSA